MLNCKIWHALKSLFIVEYGSVSLNLLRGYGLKKGIRIKYAVFSVSGLLVKMFSVIG